MNYLIILSIQLAISLTQDEHNNENLISNKLRHCDQIVGTYMDQNYQELSRNFYENKQLAVDHFYYMVTQCYYYLQNNYGFAFIDQTLIEQINWLDIISPDYYFMRDDVNLNEGELAVRKLMQNEKVKIQMEYDQNRSYFIQIMDIIDLENKVIPAIIIIMSLFFGALFYCKFYH